MEIKRLLRELLPHAAWDAIRHLLLPLIGGAGLTGAYRIIVWSRGLPQDRIIDLFVFVGSFLLLVAIYLTSRIKGAKRLPGIAEIRLITAYPAPGTPEQNLTYPSKVRCEFQNLSERSIKVRTLRWIPGPGGVEAEFPATTLQFRIAGHWCPAPHGVEELHVPPNEYFRAWIAPPQERFTTDELQRRCNANNLGIMVFLINGQEISVSI